MCLLREINFESPLFHMFYLEHIIETTPDSGIEEKQRNSNNILGQTLRGHENNAPKSSVPFYPTIPEHYV